MEQGTTEQGTRERGAGNESPRELGTVEQGQREQGNRLPDFGQGSGLVVGRFVSVVKDRVFRWLCRSVNGLGRAIKKRLPG